MIERPVEDFSKLQKSKTRIFGHSSGRRVEYSSDSHQRRRGRSSPMADFSVAVFKHKSSQREK